MQTHTEQLLNLNERMGGAMGRISCAIIKLRVMVKYCDNDFDKRSYEELLNLLQQSHDILDKD